MTIFNNPEHVKDWVSKCDGEQFVKGRYFERLEEIGGFGLVTSDGPEWKKRRDAIQPAFSPRSLERITPLTADSLQKTMETLAEKARQGGEINLYSELHLAAMQVFLRTMFSEKLAESSELIVEVMELQAKWLTGEVLATMAPSWLPVIGKRKGKPASLKLREWIQTTIDEKRASVDDSPDLLSRLLEIKNEDGSGLSDTEINNEMLQLLVGAFDTTAMALSWTIALLATNPGTMKKLQEEADAYAGSFSSMKDLEDLPYAKAAFYEAQRIQGSPFVSFEASQDSVIGGFLVPAGSQIAWSGYLQGRTNNVWDDPESFRPERFLGSAARNVHSFAHIPFGAGPHMCIGFRMALMVGLFTLTKFAKRFDVTLRPGYRVQHKMSPILGLKGGLPAILSERKNYNS